MYEIAVCDDDAVFISSFEKLLSKLLEARKLPFRLTLFSDTASLQRAIEDGQKYSLLFLDILFGEEAGIRFAKFLREKKCNTDIIFVTCCPEYAVSSYDVSPLHYLIKPVDLEKLDTALTRFLDSKPLHSLTFATPKGLLHVQITDILFFEIYDHKIIIHKTNGMKETCTGTLRELEKLLPSQTFVRPHRSYLVSLDHISEITRYQIRLSSGDTIPISKNLYRQTQSVFIDYADKKYTSYYPSR